MQALYTVFQLLRLQTPSGERFSTTRLVKHYVSNPAARDVLPESLKSSWLLKVDRAACELVYGDFSRRDQGVANSFYRNIYVNRFVRESLPETSQDLEFCPMGLLSV